MSHVYQTKHRLLVKATYTHFKLHKWKTCHVEKLQARPALPPFLVKGEVTSSGDRALRCQAPGLRGQNLKDIKRASISKTADLPNVNCHLTSLLTTNNTTTTSVPPGSCCRSGVERELNQGFSCYKSPSTPAGEQRQADRNKRPRNGTGSLFSRELKTERCSSTNRLGGKGTRR